MNQDGSRGGLSATVTHVLIAIGVTLFGILIWSSGITAITGMLLSIGWYLPLIFLPHVLVLVLEASSWCFAFSRSGCPIEFNAILRFTVSAKAVQLVTPSVSQAGEFVKIHLLCRSGIASEVSTASVIAAKTTITVSELLFIIAGLFAALASFRMEPYVMISMVAGVFLLSIVAAGLLMTQRLGLFGLIAGMSRRIPVLTKFLEGRRTFLASTDAIMKEYLGERGRFALSCLGYFLAWMAGALEAWVFLALLGLSPDLLSALVIQVWLMVVTRLTAFVPANLGTHEGGAMMIFALLGLTPQVAMAFALLRRSRQIFWTGVGLALLPRLSGAQRYAAPVGPSI